MRSARSTVRRQTEREESTKGKRQTKLHDERLAGYDESGLGSVQGIFLTEAIKFSKLQIYIIYVCVCVAQS